MRKIFKLLLLAQFLLFVNCKKEIDKKPMNKSKKNLLQKTDSFDIENWSVRTGNQIFKCINYENDSVYYRNDIYHFDYHEKPEIAEEEVLFIKGKKYIIKTTPETKDSIVKLYNLKKFEFKPKRTYQHHFEYDDCILKRKIKMDSASVHSLQMKNGSIFQIIDVHKEPMLLQVCYKGKTYKEQIQSGVDFFYDKPGKKVGTGFSKVILYDINKDGVDELLIFINDDSKLTFFADVYKINLPK